MLETEIRDVHVERYYPDVLSPAKELKNIAADVNPELVELWKRAWKWMLNTFVYDLDVQGAERWEDMLDIVPKAGASLYSRKLTILAKINSNAIYTERGFQYMLDGVYGKGSVKLSVNYNRYAITLDVISGLIPQQKKIRTYARVVIPANIGVLISNTKKVVLQKLNIGGVAKICSRIVIKPNVYWAGAELDSGQYYGGYVSIYRKVKVR